MSATDWVEIIEPKSKERIYANLDTGVCAKFPPPGATVSRAEDYSDHWWELFDTKNNKYYYYNVDRQETVWHKPQATDGKEILIIPVTKLQTYRRVVSGDKDVEKKDASTQTTPQRTSTIGTQTVSILRTSSSAATFDGSNLKGDASLLNKNRSNFARLTQQFSLNDHQPISTKHANIYRQTIPSKVVSSSHNPSRADQRFNDSCQNRLPASNLSHYLVREARAMGIALISDDEEADDEDVDSEEEYPADEEEEEEEASGSFQNHQEAHHRSEEFDNSSEGWKSLDSDQDEDPEARVTNQRQYNTQTRNCPIRLDRAPGVASRRNIYDDVYEPQNPKFPSTHKPDKLITSKLSRLETAKNVGLPHYKSDSKSSATSESHDPSSNYQEQMVSLDDEDKSPTQLLSQQLNHYKLVNNFKKKGSSTSNQSNEIVAKLNNLSTGVSSSEKSSTNTFSQLRNFSLHSQPSDHHLREVSTLSTLPRPHKFAKDKPAVSKQLVQRNNAARTDSIYDNVEDGCGYHSDSEPVIAQQQSTSFTMTNGMNTNVNDEKCSTDNGPFNRKKESRGSTFSVESFARENLTRHPKKGSLNAMLFNRKVKWSRMITWTRSTIKQSMITSLGANLNNDAIKCFKLIQQFMGDRKITLTKKLRTALIEAEASKDAASKTSNNSSIRKSWSKSPVKNSTNSLRRTLSDAGGNVPDILRDELAQELIAIGCSKSPLRDEIYVQLARQVTENPSQQSVGWGLILMAIALSYFSPSTKFAPFLFSFLENHEHPMARDVCQPRLEKRMQNNWTTYCRKPASGNEITIVRLSITKWPQYCGVFGESLDRLMKLQTCSPYLRTLQLPWILTVLGERLLETGGFKTEGIFRCAADCDMIAQLKLEIDCLDFRRITDSEQVKSLFANVVDPHIFAGLLKLFFRELPNSVFPCQLYDVCLQAANDLEATNQVVMEQVPDINRFVIGYLMRLLQILSTEENVSITKMDTSNLSMVWAPNLLRSTASLTIGLAGLGLEGHASNGSTLDRKLKDNYNAQQMVTQPQSIIFEKARQEMQFIRQLILNLDTTYIVDLL